jgi:ParB family chromosome partitioning protein
MIPVEDIRTDPELAGIFKINEEILAEVTASIKENGFDKAEPLVLWKGKNIVVDGHTRLAAARAADVFDVPCEEKDFIDVNEAVLYAVHRQTDRRNLTDAEIFAMAGELQPKLSRDGTGRAREKLAKLLNVSAAKIGQARVIANRADEATQSAVKAGEMSIRQAYEEIRQPKKEEAVSESAFVDDFAEDEELLESGKPLNTFHAYGKEHEMKDDDDEEYEEKIGAMNETRREAAPKPAAKAPASRRTFNDDFETDDDDEIIESDEWGFEEDIPEYCPPSVNLMDAVSVLLKADERNAARLLAREFVPEDEWGEFWNVLPPNMRFEE